MTDSIQDAVDSLSAADATFAATGMELLATERGRVVLALTIRPDMTNGAGVTHGGWIFMFADTAFAYLATTRRPGTLTTDADIRFHRSTRVGDRITAEASIVAQTRSSLLVDVSVLNGDGARVASFRGAGRAPRNITHTF